MIYKQIIKEIRFRGIGPYPLRETHIDKEIIINDAYLVIKNGENGVIDIREHIPSCHGDRHYYEIKYQDKTIHRIYNAEYVIIDRKEIKCDVANDLPDHLI